MERPQQRVGGFAGRSGDPARALEPAQGAVDGLLDGAGIHGTDEIGSIGHAFSHGCVRMLIPDVIDLYQRVNVGTPVYIGD